MDKIISLNISDGSIVGEVFNVMIANRPWSIQAVWSGIDSPIVLTPKHSNDGGNFNELPSSPKITSVAADGSESIDGQYLTHHCMRVDLDVQSATTGIVILYINYPESRSDL